MPKIGQTLRESRMRRRIDVSDVETATKIRAKYLRALENDEWDLLPGAAFVKSFLRTYCDYLEIDSKVLVDAYRFRYERPAQTDQISLSAGLESGRERRSPRRRVPPLVMLIICVIILVTAVILLTLKGSYSEAAVLQVAKVEAYFSSHTSAGGSVCSLHAPSDVVGKL